MKAKTAELVYEKHRGPGKNGLPLAAAAHLRPEVCQKTSSSGASRAGISCLLRFRSETHRQKRAGKPQLRIEEAKRFTEAGLSYFTETQNPLAIAAWYHDGSARQRSAEPAPCVTWITEARSWSSIAARMSAPNGSSTCRCFCSHLACSLLEGETRCRDCSDSIRTGCHGGGRVSTAPCTKSASGRRSRGSAPIRSADFGRRPRCR